MAYTKTTWRDGRTSPPINAANMNKIETGIYDAHEMATGRCATYVVAASDSLHPEQADYVCSGADDHTIINAALALGSVLCMEGHFVGGQLISPSDRVLSGLGPGTVLKLDDIVNDRFIVNSDRVGGNSNIVIENLQIDGNNSGQTAVGPADIFGNAGCIDFRNVTNLAVRNCIINNAWLAGIETTLCNDIFCTGNYIYNSSDDGIAMNDQSVHSIIANNIIVDAGQGIPVGAPCGIEIQDGSQDFAVIGNVIRNALNDGIQVTTHTPSGTLCHEGQISGNVITGCRIYLAGITGQILYRVGVTGNTVNGERVGVNVGCGVYLGADTKDCMVSNNIVSNTTDHGIEICGRRNIINGNQLYSHITNGIYFHADSDDNVAMNNRFTYCGVPILNSGSNNKIHHNVGFVTENSGTATLVNGTTSIAVAHGLAVTPVAGDIVVTPIEAWGNMTTFYIDTYTATHFTIHSPINPGQDVDFAWKATVL